jgi:hypothetical protein
MHLRLAQRNRPRILEVRQRLALQPRRFMIASSVVGCQSLLDGRLRSMFGDCDCPANESKHEQDRRRDPAAQAERLRHIQADHDTAGNQQCAENSELPHAIQIYER